MPQFSNALRERTLRSLQHRNFRLFFAGHAISVIGTWMQRVAQDWLVLELTDDALAVGVAAALQFVPMLLFGLWGGVLVDRWDRRVLLICTQAASMALAAVLALTVLLGAESLWIIYVLSLALGLVTVLDNPARQAFVASLVAPADYVNAQALASTVHNAGRLIGPAIAGALIALVGAGWAFAINAVSFIPVIWGLVLIDAAVSRGGLLKSQRGQVLEGLRYVFAHRELRACMVLLTVIALFGQNFRAVLPVLAKDTFHGGPELYGWLTGALGLGAVIGALVTAASERVTSWAMWVSAAAFALVNAVVAVAPWLWLAMVAMVGVGAVNIVFNTLSRTLLQLGSDPGMHGRVMALHGFIFLGTTPIGMPVTGWICDVAGPRAGMATAAVTALAAAVLVAGPLRRVRHEPDRVGAGL